LSGGSITTTLTTMRPTSRISNRTSRRMNDSRRPGSCPCRDRRRRRFSPLKSLLDPCRPSPAGAVRACSCPRRSLTNSVINTPSRSSARG
jgi:hypothetical protein